MGLFWGKKKEDPLEPARRPATPEARSALSELNIGSVYGWADAFLRMAGLDAPEVDRLKESYPTPAPQPNLDHVFDAGDPSNPWTLAVACAEAAIADALQVYLYAARRLVPQRRALEIYADDGLEGLARVIRFREDKENLLWAHEVIKEKIQKSFSDFFVRMLTHYLQDCWPEQKPFTARVGTG